MTRIKNNLQTVIVTTLAMLIPMIVGLALWNRLPEEMPVHFDGSGAVDGYAGKPMAVFGLSGFLLAIHILLVFCIDADPKKAGIPDKIYRIILWLMPVVTFACYMLTYMSAMHMTVNVPFTILTLLGIIYIVLGNFLPKARRNYSFGFRMRWTLDSEKNWEHTHRFAGWCCVISGLCIILIAMITSVTGMPEGLPLIVLAIAVLGMSVPTMLYSYLYYLNHKDDEDYYSRSETVAKE